MNTVWRPGSWMGRLSAERRAWILERGRKVHMLPDTILFHQGEGSRHVAVVIRGFMKISMVSEHGDDSLLAVRGPGDLLGEMAALEGVRRTATVAACTPAQLCILGHVQFLELIGHADASRALSGAIGERLWWSNRRRVDASLYEAPKRVCRLLLDLVEVFRHGSSHARRGGFDIRLTQNDLASLSGLGRATVERVLRGLHERGVVQRLYGSIVVLDLAALTREAESGPIPSSEGMPSLRPGQGGGAY